MIYILTDDGKLWSIREYLYIVVTYFCIIITCGETGEPNGVECLNGEF